MSSNWTEREIRALVDIRKETNKVSTYISIVFYITNQSHIAKYCQIIFLESSKIFFFRYRNICYEIFFLFFTEIC